VSSSPDPIDDPSAYQQHLLGLLGDDDPADVQAASAAAWRALVAEAEQAVAQRPEPDEWLGHAHDAEIVYSGRYRWILAHDEPPLIGYDQDLWVTRLNHNDADPDELIEVFEALRAANLALWSRTSDRDKQRVGMHAERGPESFDLSFRLIGGHDRFHLAQAGRAIEALAR
jgi:hypothetical protein